MKYDHEKSLGANAERIGLRVTYGPWLNVEWIKLKRGEDLIVANFSHGKISDKIKELMATACPECTKPTRAATKLTPDARTCDDCGWLGAIDDD